MYVRNASKATAALLAVSMAPCLYFVQSHLYILRDVAASLPCYCRRASTLAKPRRNLGGQSHHNLLLSIKRPVHSTDLIRGVSHPESNRTPHLFPSYRNTIHLLLSWVQCVPSIRISGVRD